MVSAKLEEVRGMRIGVPPNQPDQGTRPLQKKGMVLRKEFWGFRLLFNLIFRITLCLDSIFVQVFLIQRIYLLRC